ncbi:MAG: hypothetical protein NTY22_05415 [Proteobacteria bacterium]|nr:hypothetical protein [Pseudomonadota bacterium]
MDSLKVSYDHLSESFNVPVKGTYGSDITWTTAPEGVIIVDNRTGLVTVKRDNVDYKVVLTATVKRDNSAPLKKEFTLFVKSKKTRMGIHSNSCIGLDTTGLNVERLGVGCIIFEFSSPNNTGDKIKLIFLATDHLRDTFYVNGEIAQMKSEKTEDDTRQFMWVGNDSRGLILYVEGDIDIPSIDKVILGNEIIFRAASPISGQQ